MPTATPTSTTTATPKTDTPPRATSQYKRAFSAAQLFSFPALLLNLTTASASPEFCTGSSVVKCKVPACSVEVGHGCGDGQIEAVGARGQGVCRAVEGLGQQGMW